jgi:hypothetical protein
MPMKHPDSSPATVLIFRAGATFDRPGFNKHGAAR